MKDLIKFINESKSNIDENILKNIHTYYDGGDNEIDGHEKDFILVLGYKNHGAWKNQKQRYFLKIDEIKEYANQNDLYQITDFFNKKDDRGFTYSMLFGYDPESKFGWEMFAILHRQKKLSEWNDELANKYLKK